MARKGLRIWQNCKKCLSTGKLYQGTKRAIPVNEKSKDSEDTYTEVDCVKCEGIGLIHWGWLNEEAE
jgi:hypothetical protein